MNREDFSKLRQETYELWYKAKDKKVKKHYKKVLDLIDFTEKTRTQLKAIEALFQEIV